MSEAAALTATLVACATLAGALSALPTRADDKVSAPVPRAQGWLMKSYEQIERPAAPAAAADGQAVLKAMVAPSASPRTWPVSIGGRPVVRFTAGTR